MPADGRVKVLVHLLAGAAILLAVVLADYIFAGFPGWGFAQNLTLLAGLTVVIFGFIPWRVVSRVSTNFCISLLSLFVFLVLCESFFRAIGFDFAKQELIWRMTPVFYRHPIVPTGEAFFRRSGPEEWTGQVLNTMLRQQNIQPNPYGKEPAVTIRYDRNGFRNPEEMSDWDVVVAGDSSTELGYLPYEELFTTLLGKLLNVGVLNLGVSYTGPLTQLSYLQDYGVSAKTRHAVIVFFEGNDLEDLNLDYEALIRWQKTRQREYREFKKQSSLIKALPGLLRSLQVLVKPTDAVSAHFKSAAEDLPITLAYAPPGRSQLSDQTMYQLNYFFAKYAAFGRERHLTVWLAYMPTKERVIHGQLTFVDGASEKLRNWQPTDLPETFATLCEQHGINFIDLTPALVNETNSRRQLVYNGIYDTHLNTIGSHVVAREMARHLATMR